MQCFIYKGRKKADAYLYICREDDFDDVPQALLRLLGDLEKVMSLDLAVTAKLANADIDQVRASLASQGYYIQLPPNPHITSTYH